ncbi:CzcE family metal-binding protein [Janthinobacterium sp. MDT1-19]|uniref:CzcE family metal-binding protein n=1 Tax=Janthinobacterium sp. MDT1-19 TaxID=1259339 RepID=UPI003F2980DB
MKFLKPNIVAVFAVIVLSPLAAMAHQGEMHLNPAFGSAAPAPSATCTITISSATKYVNVTQGDVVKFDVDGKTFTWQFDTLRTKASFDFSAIAPSGVNTHGVRVYVAANPIYAN